MTLSTPDSEAFSLEGSTSVKDALMYCSGILSTLVFGMPKMLSRYCSMCAYKIGSGRSELIL